MTLSDFFIGSRQFFGFITPGLVWLVAFGIPFLPHSIALVVTQAGTLEVLFFVLVAFVLGTAVESISFNLAVRLSAAIRRDQVSREPHDSDYFPSSVSSDLVARCRELATRCEMSPGFVKSLTDR